MKIKQLKRDPETERRLRDAKLLQRDPARWLLKKLGDTTRVREMIVTLGLN